MSPVTALLTSGERFAQQLRPARLSWTNGPEGGIPCTPGNLDFFERLKSDGGGLQSIQGLYVKILRSDISSTDFKSGQAVTVTDTESGDTHRLIVGQNNSKQAAVLILNLEKLIV